MFRCSGVQVYRCSGVLVFRVDDILEGQKGDQGGAQKMAKIQHGVKPDIFKRAAQKCAQFRVGGKFSTFWASSSAQKVLLTAEKVGVGPKLTEKITMGVKHGHL